MAKKKVLVVDDETDIIEVVRKLLEVNNYKVITAHNGKEAVKTSKSKQPDLVLMDINMPEMDGFTAATFIKADKATAHIPILMLTVDDSLESIGRAYHLEIEGYVVKYLISVSLIDRIAEVLKSKEGS